MEGLDKGSPNIREGYNLLQLTGAMLVTPPASSITAFTSNFAFLYTHISIIKLT